MNLSSVRERWDTFLGFVSLDDFTGGAGTSVGAGPGWRQRRCTWIVKLVQMA